MKWELVMKMNWLSWKKDKVSLKREVVFVDFNKEMTKVEHGVLFSAVGTL